jgi:hypothetical protein
MQRHETLSFASPLLQHRQLRVMLLSAPLVTVVIASATAIIGNLALVVIVNLIAAAVVYTVLFIAVSSVARRVDRLSLGRISAPAPQDNPEP